VKQVAPYDAAECSVVDHRIQMWIALLCSGAINAITTKKLLPSICMRISDLTLLLASCSFSVPRLEQMESISSKNTVLGA
jgi:hypothetical protein